MDELEYESKVFGLVFNILESGRRVRWCGVCECVTNHTTREHEEAVTEGPTEG